MSKTKQNDDIDEIIGRSPEQTIHEAIYAASGEFGSIKPNAANPGFKRNGKPTPYVTLDALEEHLRPILHRHGLRLSHHVGNSAAGLLKVATTVWHRSGSSLEISAPEFQLPAGCTPQALTSTVTYFKRMNIMSGLGFSTEFGADDDGNAASGGAPKGADLGW